jgi:hypothetical protein
MNDDLSDVGVSMSEEVRVWARDLVSLGRESLRKRASVRKPDSRAFRQF